MKKPVWFIKLTASWKLVAVAVISLLVGVIIARFIPFNSNLPAGAPTEKTQSEQKKHHEFWTCSMHPQVRQPKPGKCPICFMDLVPVKTTSPETESHMAELTLSPRAQKLAEVETVPVERKFVKKPVRMVGMVDYDESRIAHITARMPGRVDKLYVNYTGIAVRKGDHMVGYYSPDLYVAQKELLQSAKAYSQMDPGADKESLLDRLGDSRNLNEKDIFNSVIKRLKLWGLTDINIKNILKTGKVVDLITLYAPISGIVIHKNAIEGRYFKTGDSLFTIADLSRVWIKLDAYESDIPWLHYGQMVKFTTKSYPGETFEGRISFIDPFLDPATRTVKLRVDAANSSGKLKPNMFVNATVYSDVSREGRAIAPDLVGKWICPMHPDVIKDHPGKCDICGMKLVKSESLGYITEKNQEPPLVIPASAPLITGERAVVYINDKPGHFYGQEIKLGPRAGNYYIVKSGLKAGQMVVVNGNFKIDSALQIQARPSMMNMDTSATTKPAGSKNENTETTHKMPKMFNESLKAVYAAYFSLQKALADDNWAKAKVSAGKMSASLKKVYKQGADQETLKTLESISAVAGGIEAAKDITAARTQFSKLTAPMDALLSRTGSPGKTVYKFFCPMFMNNRGAYWFQDNPDLVNPYYGDVMLKCGEKVKEFAK